MKRVRVVSNPFTGELSFTDAPLTNAFCATGKGGGRDNSCGKGKGKGKNKHGQKHQASVDAAHEAAAEASKKAISKFGGSVKGGLKEGLKAAAHQLVHDIEHLTLGRYRDMSKSFGPKAALAITGASVGLFLATKLNIHVPGLEYAAAAVPLGVARAVKTVLASITTNAVGDGVYDMDSLVAEVQKLVGDVCREAGVEGPKLSIPTIRKHLAVYLK